MRWLTLFLLLTACFAGGCAMSPDARARWVTDNGGIITGQQDARAREIMSRLVAGLTGAPVHVQVLGTRELTAYSFPDGALFVSRGLMEAADNDEVAAAMAHELGHLISDGHLQGPAALHRKNENPDVEARADDVGCRVLQMEGVPPRAMMRMLELVADRTCPGPCCNDLHVRIARLKTSLPAPSL